jgi:hypothetical protein
MVPPDGQPQTFTDHNDAIDEDFERPYLRDITLQAGSENAARIVCERQAFDIATQEVAQSGEHTDDPDASMEAVLARQWQIKSIESEDAPATAPTESTPEA